MDLSEFPGWSTRFDLLWRQEQSRHASGRTRVKDFGRPIWYASFTTGLLRPNAIDRWRAELDALGNGLDTFDAWSMSRCWPIAHPNGSGLGSSTGTVFSVGEDNASLRIQGFPGLFLSVGDMIRVDGNLYRVTSSTVAAAGITGVFSVAPYLWPGVAEGDPVVIERPHVSMTVVPGSVSTASGLNGRGAITFDAVEARG